MSLLNHVLSVKSKHKNILSILKQKVILISTQSFVDIKKEINNESTLNFHYNRLNELLVKKSWRMKAFISLIFSLVSGAGFYLYFFRKEVTDVVADTVSHVASKSLEDDCLLTSAQSQGKILITNIFNDIEMQNQATIFVTKILSQKETEEATNRLLLSVVNDPIFYNTVATKLQNISVNIANSEEIRNAIYHQLHSVLTDPNTQEVLSSLIHDVLIREEVKNYSVEFVNEVLASKEIYEESKKLGFYVIEQILNDEAIKEKTAEAFWSIIKCSLVPSKLWSKSPASDDQKIDPSIDDRFDLNL